MTKKKQIIKIALWVLTLFMGYKIYISIDSSLNFDKIKVKRFSKVINRMKMIKKSEEAYRTIIGTYASDFNALIKFIDTAKFTLVQKRDTSWMEYDKVYRIDVLKQDVVIDTLGFVTVRDSLFRGTNDYKEMKYIPNAPTGTEFVISTGNLIKAGYKIPVFEVKANKKDVLRDQMKDLVTLEQKALGVDEIDGSYITVGSLNEVSTSGNWPTLYDSSER